MLVRFLRKITKVLRPKNSKLFNLYQYTDSDGNFNYGEYVRIQVAGNKSKIDRSWVTKEEIDFYSKIIKDYIGNVNNGICHGTRRGLEQKWFKENLNADVIGTEISDTASQFPDTIQWDFHKVKPAWNGYFDFIYSNSLDHSYDPKLALTNWMTTLAPGGICILAHSKDHSVDESRELDPFGVKLEFFPYLVLEWSEGRFAVVEIRTFNNDRKCLVLKNNPNSLLLH